MDKWTRRQFAKLMDIEVEHIPEKLKTTFDQYEKIKMRTSQGGFTIPELATIVMIAGFGKYAVPAKDRPPRIQKSTALEREIGAPPVPESGTVLVGGQT